jgi:predicted transcriptional regulator
MKKSIIVEGSLQEAAQRFADVWRKVERGEPITPQDTISFLTWSALASVMTDKRLELLRHLHHNPALSIRGLARELGRDYKSVHEDLALLERIGLVEHQDNWWRADYDEIQASIRLLSPAT